MKLMSLKQYSKMSKPALIRKITKALRAMPKAKLARLCYNMTKSKLPRLRVRKSLAYNGSISRKRKTKRIFIKKDDRYVMKKFSRKQLAAQRLFAKRARAGTLRKTPYRTAYRKRMKQGRVGLLS